jgi:mannosyl-oligosaccharide alpha-1,2-mannosidase
VIETLIKIKPEDGLYPVYISTEETTTFSSEFISIGILGDHFYEYLFKSSLYDPENVKLKFLFDDCLEGIKNKLLRVSSPTQFFFLGQLRHNLNPVMNNKMDDSICSFAGFFFHASQNNPDLKHFSEISKKILDTCLTISEKIITHLNPQSIVFNTQSDAPPNSSDYYIHSTKFSLYSGLLESIFIFYKLTGDQIYQNYAWKFFVNILKSTLLPNGFSGLQDVSVFNSFNDKMEPFFFSKTLKYLYLIFEDRNVLPLSNYVFK